MRNNDREILWAAMIRQRGNIQRISISVIERAIYDRIQSVFSYTRKILEIR